VKEELRLLYQLDNPRVAPAHLEAWLAWASKIAAQGVRETRPPAAATARACSPQSALDSPTDALEGLNSHIHLISDRSFGVRSPGALLGDVDMLL
jgi:hypothetical protein